MDFIKRREGAIQRPVLGEHPARGRDREGRGRVAPGWALMLSCPPGAGVLAAVPLCHHCLAQLP